ncbi:MAG TPA: MarR family winged helix-turn-helix transcriptional regulator [Streptosporangiaceae bacterium]|jgi:DNA-binding MarR family transcriptional regulator/predicted GNAT family N-acyltransferase|nr:MarR family winged helix-turn-helix transcriptional regulator [Streptosporangiaceae bacterium]
MKSDEDLTARVRSFNRTVTQRVGALSDHYLARDRPLGASRVLWEIGPGGTDARALRARLDLDSGYLSRLLRGLQDEGLIRMQPAEGDHRVRTAVLTDAGRAERAELDRLSDELAASLLAPLNDRQRDQLAAAMGTVERLLTAGLVMFTVADPASPEARACMAAYFAELGERFDGGFDPGASLPATDGDLVSPAGLLLLARLHGEPVGCGALKFHGTEPAELKRMWVANRARGLGLGRRLLAELEDQARRHGATVVRLETNQALTEAITLYRSAGYAEVAAFSDEQYAHHWFEKHLDGP